MSERRTAQQRGDGMLKPLLSSSPPVALGESLPSAVSGSGGSGRWPARRRAASPGPRTVRPTGRAVAGAQQLQVARQKDKWVPLPAEEEDDDDVVATTSAADPSGIADGTAAQPHEAFTSLTIAPGLFHDLDPSGGASGRTRGRITLYCCADSFDRRRLDEVLRASFPASSLRSEPDVFVLEYFPASPDGTPGGDIYFFDWGVVAAWGLERAQEAAVMRSIVAAAANQPLALDAMEVDEFEFNITSSEKPHIQNDTVTLHKRAAKDYRVKLAISFALAQSTKLSLHERRVVTMVGETKHLPESLAATGKVALPPSTIARLIGKVFIEKSAVNLLSSVLDTPEYFWRAPDSLQALYERICEYMELEERVEVLNARFAVLGEMLDMLRDHENNHHSARLEWIVIWLIVVEVVVGLLEVLGLFGLVGQHH